MGLSWLLLLILFLLTLVNQNIIEMYCQGATKSFDDDSKHRKEHVSSLSNKRFEQVWNCWTGFSRLRHESSSFFLLLGRRSVSRKFLTSRPQDMISIHACSDVCFFEELERENIKFRQVFDPQLCFFAAFLWIKVGSCRGYPLKPHK